MGTQSTWGQCFPNIIRMKSLVLISLISLISTAPAPQEEEAPEALPYVHEEIEALPYVHDDTGDVSDDISPEALPYVRQEIDALPYVHEEIDALPYVHEDMPSDDSKPAMPAMPVKPVLTVGVLGPVLSYSGLPLISPHLYTAYHGTGCLNSKGSVVPCLL